STNEILLQSSEGILVHMPRTIAKCSGLLRGLLETIPREVEQGKPIPLHSINEATLKLIEEWYQYHIDNPIVYNFDNYDKNNKIQDRERELLNVDEVMLLRII
ncbi:hypothetical protein BKA67DRAFT_505883, partial [Truncatella angustata]